MLQIGLVDVDLDLIGNFWAVEQKENGFFSYLFTYNIQVTCNKKTQTVSTESDTILKRGDRTSNTSLTVGLTL